MDGNGKLEVEMEIAVVRDKNSDISQVESMGFGDYSEEWQEFLSPN